MGVVTVKGSVYGHRQGMAQAEKLTSDQIASSTFLCNGSKSNKEASNTTGLSLHTGRQKSFTTLVEITHHDRSLLGGPGRLCTLKVLRRKIHAYLYETTTVKGRETCFTL